MELRLLRLQQRQVKAQCKAALLALSVTGQAYEELEKPTPAVDQVDFWPGIQFFPTAAGNISKSLWGQGGRLAEARLPLRESLEVTDENPLSTTDLRNHLEHFDERLDRWFSTSPTQSYADMIIGPAKTNLGGLAPGDVFRHFDPATREVISWGEHHAMGPLNAEILRLLPIAEREGGKIAF